MLGETCIISLSLLLSGPLWPTLVAPDSIITMCKQMTGFKLWQLYSNTWNHLTVHLKSSDSFKNVIDKMCSQTIYIYMCVCVVCEHILLYTVKWFQVLLYNCQNLTDYLMLNPVIYNGRYTIKPNETNCSSKYLKLYLNNKSFALDRNTWKHYCERTLSIKNSYLKPWLLQMVNITSFKLYNWLQKKKMTLALNNPTRVDIP